MDTTDKKVVRLTDRTDGYGLSDDRLDYIDERGPAYPTKSEALNRAREGGYTHYMDLKGNVRKLTR